MVGACSTFAFATETTVEELKNCSKNENTAKNTGFGSLFGRNHWCVDKEITDEIENYEVAELNTFLAYFYAQKNNKKGEDYKPESLKLLHHLIDTSRTKAAPCPLYVTENLVCQKRCWRTKRNSFVWLAVVSAQTKLGKEEILWKSRKLEVITQNL